MMHKLYQHPTTSGALYQSGLQDAENAWSKVDIIIDVDGYEPLRNDLPLGCMLLRWKIEDGPLPNIEVLELLGKFISRLVIQGKNVLVHCAAGQNRSALVASSSLYYLMQLDRRFSKTGNLGSYIHSLMKSVNPLSLTNYSFANFVLHIHEYLN